MIQVILMLDELFRYMCTRQTAGPKDRPKDIQTDRPKDRQTVGGGMHVCMER